MAGTGWERNAHLTPRVITALSGAEHLGEVNSWPGSRRKQGEVQSLQKERMRAAEARPASQVASRAKPQGFFREGSLGSPSPRTGHSTGCLAPAPGCLEFQSLRTGTLGSLSILVPSPPIVTPF